MTRRVTRQAQFLLLLCCPLLIAAPAMADVVVPFVMLTGMHLLVGTAIIGIVEGLIIVSVFKTKTRAIPLMVAANYASAVAGFALLRGVDLLLASRAWKAYNGVGILVGAVLVMFALTVAMEWPFCWLSLGERPGRRRKALWASLLVQAISYLLLMPAYFMACRWYVYR